MKPINLGGHPAYQSRVLAQLRKYYPDADSSIDAATWDIMEQFWCLDLSPVDQIMWDRYSNFGPAPRLPSDMLRSYLLSLKFKVTSITSWSSQLKQNHLYAILSGFVVGDTPGVGTFYDFSRRLWNSDKNNTTTPIHPPREKPKKPGKKGKKAPPVEKVTVYDLLERFEIEPPQDFAPAKRLFEIFKSLFLEHSIQQGLVKHDSLALSGDGTPVYTGAFERKTRTCNCLEKGIRDCKCNRIYHQPDCNIGWDSHRNRYYFGYDLYMLTASDSENDLPVFPLLGPASRHDSQGFLYTWFSMRQYFPEATVSKLLLDSAHDSMAMYEYCAKNGIKPFIDLNGKGGRPPVYKDDFTIGDDGVPVCKEGFRMRLDGTERKKGRTKYKCPRISFIYGFPVCTCKNRCSDAFYGRTVHVAIKDNPRLFNDPPRGSKEWKLEYNARTSSERCNKREKIDYKLEDGRHRSTKMWYCRLFAIMMCQHLDAWALPKSSQLKDLF